jgi:gamma-butyrobetaine dioxygenase
MFTLAKFDADGATLVHKASKETLVVPAVWLGANASERRHALGQVVSTLEDLAAPQPDTLRRCEVDAEREALRCVLTTSGAADGAETAATVPLRYVEEYGMRRFPTAGPPPLTSAAGLRRVTYASIAAALDDASDADGTAALCAALVADGVAIVSDCPSGDATVTNIGSALAPAAGPISTLYGKSWHVRRPPAALTRDDNTSNRNIAYSGAFLDLHNDLAYYESMPGIQLLHCQSYHAKVTGGESFFVDAFAAAADLRERDRAAFDVLTAVPVPTMKDDAQRANAAKYYYAKPLIALNHEGEIVKVLWSPAFEAPMPLHLGAAALARFYAAYRAFAKVLLEWRTEKAVRFRLEAGECVVWLQGRVLHGRAAFEEPEPGMRQLHGCYVNVDDFANRARTLLPADTRWGPMSNGSYI